MENASKALIIAGAILLAILIIGLGIFIYRQAANTVSDTGMDQLAIQQFNGQFENFLDKNMSATTAKSLIDTINANNEGKTSGSDGWVDCNIEKTAIESGKKYIARVPSDDSDPGKTKSGMIKKINISEVTD